MIYKVPDPNKQALMKTVAAIPAYNEALTIGEVVEKANKHIDQVIVVDDGSKDDTSLAARMAGATVIRHRKNRGYGEAIKSAFYSARKYDADALVILDADGQHEPDEIPRLLTALEEGNYDIVIGSRHLEKTNGKEIPAYRKIGLKILDAFTKAAANGSYDSQSGYRAYSRRALHILEPEESGMSVGSEILIQAQNIGLIIGQVPITVKYNTRKPPRSPMKHGATVMISLIKLIAEKHPLIFFGVTGIVFMGAGIYTGASVMRTYDETSQLAIGRALVTAILAISGIFLAVSAMTLYAIQDTVKKALRENDAKRKMIELTIEESEKKMIGQRRLLEIVTD